MRDDRKMDVKSFSAPRGYLYPTQAKQTFCNGLKARCKGVSDCGHAAESALTFCNEDFEKIAVLEFGEGIKFAANEANTEFCFSPFGDFSHKYGLQRVTKEAAQEMANAAKELFAKVKNKFGTAIPVYYGHPDDPAFGEKYPDKTVYGKVVSVKAGDMGAIANIEWGKGFESLPRGLKFSPRWRVRECAEGVYSPFELISLGLTTRPNIPGVSAANEDSENISDKQTQSKENTMDILKKMLETLGYSAEQIEAVISGAEGAPSLEEILAKLEPEKKEELKEEKQKTEEAANEAALQEQVKNERLAHAKTVVSNSQMLGKSTKAEESELVSLLANSTNFAGTAKLIMDRPVQYKTSGKTDGLGRRNSTEISASNEFEEIVTDIMKKNPKLPRNAAWTKAREANPELYAKLGSAE